MHSLSPRKSEQPLPGCELQGKEEEKDEKHIRKMIRKNENIKTGN